MDKADSFLRQCVIDGRMTEAEYLSVRLDRESSECTRPDWKEFTAVPDDVLAPLGLTVRDCEIYINYPAWTLAAIAERTGITIKSVRRALARVRGCFPSLCNDPSGNQGLPNLSHMIPLDAPNVYEPDIMGEAVKF